VAHYNRTCSQGVWTLLTDSDVTELRVQNTDAVVVELQATAGTTEPSSRGGALTLGAGGIVLPDTTLANLFPGVTGAARIWALPRGGVATLSVSHA